LCSSISNGASADQLAHVTQHGRALLRFLDRVDRCVPKDDGVALLDHFQISERLGVDGPALIRRDIQLVQTGDVIETKIHVDRRPETVHRLLRIQ
jgi:hypothetical protein